MQLFGRKNSKKAKGIQANTTGEDAPAQSAQGNASARGDGSTSPDRTGVMPAIKPYRRLQRSIEDQVNFIQGRRTSHRYGPSEEQIAEDKAEFLSEEEFDESQQDTAGMKAITQEQIAAARVQKGEGSASPSASPESLPFTPSEPSSFTPSELPLSAPAEPPSFTPSGIGTERAMRAAAVSASSIPRIVDDIPNIVSVPDISTDDTASQPNTAEQAKAPSAPIPQDIAPGGTKPMDLAELRENAQGQTPHAPESDASAQLAGNEEHAAAVAAMAHNVRESAQDTINRSQAYAAQRAAQERERTESLVSNAKGGSAEAPDDSGSTNPAYAPADARSSRGAVRPRPSARTRQGGKPRRRRRRIAALDGLKLLCAFAVILSIAAPPVLPGGFMVATVFFVLAGYLLTNRLIGELGATGSINVWRFLKRRIRRTFPTMIVAVLVMAIATALLAPALLAELHFDALPALIYIDNWFYVATNMSIFPVSGLQSPVAHFWFLAVLMQFCILWPALMWAFSRIFRTRLALRRVTGALVAISWIAMVLAYGSHNASNVFLNTGLRAGELLSGAWLAFVLPFSGRPDLRGLKPIRFIRDRIGQLAVSRTITCAIGGIAIVAIAIECFTVHPTDAYAYRGGLIFTALLSVLLIAMIVGDQKNPLARVLSFDVLATLGKRALSLFVWAWPLLTLMNPANRASATPWWAIIVEIIIVGAVAELSYRAIERHTSSGEIGAAARRVTTGDFSFGSLSRARKVTTIGACALTLVAVVLVAAGPFWNPNVLATNEASAGAGGARYTSSGLVCDTNFLLIGNDDAKSTHPYFQTVFPKATLDAESSWTIADGATAYRSAVTASGSAYPTVVFMLSSPNGATEDQIRDDISAVGSDAQIYFVNEPASEHNADSVNSLLSKVSESYVNVSIIDWHSVSEGHDEYFSQNGTGLSDAGCNALIELVRKSVDPTGASSHSVN